jgi:hypothetical protein
MKNFLIVLGVLLGCFTIAVFLVLFLPAGIRAGAPGTSYMIATWRDYDDADLKGLDVSVGTNDIVIDVPATPVYKQIMEKGHWNLHAFYCDSHVDSPPEVEVARELKNEDLEVDINRYLPSHAGKIICVKVARIIDIERPLYPENVPGQKVSYPPPKGLIRVGMLQWDLEMLPWRADHIESAPIVINVDTSTLSDGKRNQNFFPSEDAGNDDNDELSQVYTYHSDRADAPKLLVTVYHGRVTEVTGGAEETSDVPYQLPPSPSPATESPDDAQRSWAAWWFDLLFKK